MDTSATASQPPPPVRPPTPAPASASDFGSFYEETLKPLRRYLSRLLRTPQDAQDIAQDAYIKTFTALQGGHVEKPRSFLFVTARHLASNFRIRRADRMRPLDTTELESCPAPGLDAAEQAMAAESVKVLDSALESLPRGCRQVFALRHVHGLSLDEIALKLGISRSGVEKQVSRALRLLRERMINRSE